MPITTLVTYSSSPIYASTHRNNSCLPLHYGRAFRTSTQIQRYPTRRQASVSSNQNDQNNMLDSMEEPVETLVGDLHTQTTNSAEEQELFDFVSCIAKAADGRKADDIVALKVSHVTTLCSCLVILSGNSRPQNQAITAAIQNEVIAKYDQRPGGSGVPEGSSDSGWMLLDYGSVMVHIMTPKSRLYYNVEGQWRDKGGVEMDISHVLIPNKPESITGDLTGDNGFVEKEDDPFWS
jgi:ribosome-associated protein